VYPKTNGFSLQLGEPPSLPLSLSLSLSRALVAHILLDRLATLGHMLDPTFGASDPRFISPQLSRDTYELHLSRHVLLQRLCW